MSPLARQIITGRDVLHSQVNEAELFTSYTKADMEMESEHAIAGYGTVCMWVDTDYGMRMLLFSRASTFPWART